MIIARLSAENVLRHARLELEPLPADGVVAVSGPNESGKTALAETIAFALFGRTVSLPPKEIAKVIRWGESRCRVTLDFLVGDQRYRLTRQLDDGGNQGARLDRAGDPAPLARGPDEVRLALHKLLGWGFEEFVESFYLPQRETSETEQHSAAVKAMAGVAALETVSASLADEVRLHEAAVAEVERQIADLRAQIVGLGVREEALPELEARRVPVVARQTEQTQEIAELARLTSRLAASVPRVQAAATALATGGVDTPTRLWREYLESLARSLADAQAVPGGLGAARRLDALVRDARERLAAVEAIGARSQDYRRHLAHLLEEAPDAEPTPDAEPPLPRQLARARRARTGCSVGLIVALLVGLLAGGGWGLVTLRPEASVARTVAAALPPTARDALLPVGAVAAIFVAFFGIATAVFGSRIGRVRRRLDAARREAEALDTLDTAPLPAAVAALQELGDDSLREAARQLAEGPGAALLEPETLARRREELRELARTYEADVATATEQIARRTGLTQRELEVETGRLAEMDRAITDEKDRRRQDQDLARIIGELQTRAAERRRRIAARTKARELLAGACHEISQRFNREIRVFVGRTLPLLTEGRYAHLQIDETLRVRVFSSDKRDFMDLEETSGGTQRQVALAVRLALSERLVANTQGGPQFVFLDEPFALFDDTRTRAALDALPRLSERIRQIWIVAQRFPDDASVALHIRCALDLDELTVPRA